MSDTDRTMRVGARVIALLEEIEKARGWAAKEANINAKLEAEIASLKSQLAEAQKDRDRLDWLFGVLNSDEIRRRLSLVEEKHAYGSWASTPIRVGDFRAAFDFAMEAEKNG